MSNTFHVFQKLISFCKQFFLQSVVYILRQSAEDLSNVGDTLKMCAFQILLN